MWPFSRPKKKPAVQAGRRRTAEQKFDQEKWLAARELLRGNKDLRDQVGLMALGLTPDDPAEAAAKDAEAAAKTAEAAYIRASKDIGRELALARIEATKRGGSGGQTSPFDQLLQAMQAMRQMREFADENGGGEQSRGGETLGAQIGDVLRGLSPVLAAALPLMLGGRMDPNALAALQQGYAGAMLPQGYAGQEGDGREEDDEAPEQEALTEAPPQASVMPVPVAVPAAVPMALPVAAALPMPEPAAARPPMAVPVPVSAETTPAAPVRRAAGRPRKAAKARPPVSTPTPAPVPTPVKAIPDPPPLEPVFVLALARLPAVEAAAQAWRILQPALQNQADAERHQLAWALTNLLLSDESEPAVLAKLRQLTQLMPDLKAWRPVVAALGRDLVWLAAFRRELAQHYDAAAQPKAVVAEPPPVPPAVPVVAANGYLEPDRLPTIMR